MSTNCCEPAENYIHADKNFGSPSLHRSTYTSRFPSGCSTGGTNTRGKIFAPKGDKSSSSYFHPLPSLPIPDSQSSCTDRQPHRQANLGYLDAPASPRASMGRKVSSGNASSQGVLTDLGKRISDALRSLVCGTSARNVFLMMLHSRELRPIYIYSMCKTRVCLS